VLGYLSWELRRKHVHRADVLQALTEDAVSRDFDHTVVVGDLTNIALPGEFPAALSWLRSLGDPARVSVVPGNHDAYVSLPWEPTIATWRDYMTADGGVQSDVCDAHTFPWVRLRDRIALVGVNTAVATWPFLATGEVGEQQSLQVEQALRELGTAGHFRVVLIHHPPIDSLTKWRKRLTDSARFQAVIARTGAELILHGHTHNSTVAWMPGPVGAVPVVGVTSSSCDGSENTAFAARYNVYRIDGEAPDWRIELEPHGWQRDGTIRSIERIDLHQPPEAK
jgi:3',5'-cyclic AMP phosphodiesterase CpdA